MKMSAECLHLMHAVHVRRRRDGNQICCNIRARLGAIVAALHVISRMNINIGLGRAG